MKKFFCSLLCVLALSPSALALEGMDVSIYQDQIDFAAAKAGGIEAVYIRSGYGQDGVEGCVDRDRFTGDILLAPPQEQTFSYTVRRGDTLWDLSRRFGTTVEALVRLNHIANPDLIYPGQVLQLPA